MNITSIRDRALVRLISDARHKPPVLRALVDTDQEAELLAELEGETSARLRAERQRSAVLEQRQRASTHRARDLRVYGQSHINAAFAYPRKTGNRFNGPERGAWYCAWHVLTSAEEVGFHRTRELSFIGCLEDEAHYVELLADFIGDFPDLHGERGHPALEADIERGYPAGQKLAALMRQDGYQGVIYPSVRHPGGRCFVALDPGIVQNVRPGARWKLVWRGTPDFVVEGV